MEEEENVDGPDSYSSFYMEPEVIIEQGDEMQEVITSSRSSYRSLVNIDDEQRVVTPSRSSHRSLVNIDNEQRVITPSRNSHRSLVNIDDEQRVITPSRSSHRSLVNIDDFRTNLSRSAGEDDICTSRQENYDTVLCAYLKMNKLAAACFVSETLQLLTMSSVIEEGPEYALMVTLINQVNPSILITGSNCSKLFAKVLFDLIEEDCTCHRISSKHFNYENCKTRVLNMKVPGETSEDKEQYVLTSLDLSDEELISAVGALLNYLDNDSHRFRYDQILSIRPLYLNNIVHLDEESYINLQVFNPVEHPSGFKWNNKKQNQGISLYTLLSKYCGKISLSHLRLFLTRPTNNTYIIKERHEVILFSNDPKNYQFIDNIKKYLHNMSTLPVFIGSIRGSALRGVHWKIIYKNIHFGALIGEMCRGYAEAVPYFKKVGELLTSEIYALANHIYRTVDFDAMENSEKFVIKFGVRKELDTAKKKFHFLQETIDKVTPYEFSCVPDFVAKIRIVYIPEIRFLLAIPYWKEDLTKKELELPDLDYKFSAFKIAYYKSKRCKEMDSLLGDPQLEIMQEESEIILELLKFIEDNLHILLKFIRKLIELDCIFSLAALAKEFNYKIPILTDDKLLNIVNGKHPLLSVKIENFIANDTISQDPMSVQVLYGANSSGKTVFLKQVALLAYMAHIGSFLPAEHASIGLLNNIYVHMKIMESVSLKSSTFLSDLRKLSTLVRGSGGRSLAVLDEVCKGTNETSSVPIVNGLLRYFTHLDFGSRPHILLATHIDLPSSQLPKHLLYFSTMSFIMENEDLTFLYKVVNGSRPNLALDVALMCGASRQTILTASEVIMALRTGESVYPYSLKRVERWKKFNEFLKRFATVKITTPQFLEKIKRKFMATYS